ncbi:MULTISPECIES: hypothetical protein [unclassified Bradyrhizobium]|uniref:hypothetical protein n=1 Tax=unclassified Bradyrhizobium TaxID=2631580 RepID=UPI0028EE4FB0|nr:MULTISPECIES: hypothetical protein [unclassified Bradyrhizobium]
MGIAVQAIAADSCQKELGLIVQNIPVESRRRKIVGATIGILKQRREIRSKYQ